MLHFTFATSLMQEGMDRAASQLTLYAALATATLEGGPIECEP